MYHKEISMATMPMGNGHVENWADSSGMADNSQQTDDTSTDVDTDDKIQVGIHFSSKNCYFQSQLLFWICIFMLFSVRNLLHI